MIDIHTHIGHFEGYDLSEETLLANLRRGGIELALVSNLDGAAVPGKTRDLPEPEINREAAACVRRSPDRLRGLLWGRPDRGDGAELRPFFAERIPESGADSDRWTRRLFVGIKLHPEMNDFPADHPRVDPYLEVAGEAGVPVVIHSDARVDRASATRILALAARHPDVPVVLYHMGFHGPHGPVIREVADALDGGAENLYLETAQADPASVLEAVGALGAERVLFGTDASYYGTDHYAHYHPMIDAMDRHLRATERESVRRENALRLFRLAGEADTDT